MGCVAEVLAPVYTGKDNRISLILFGNGAVLSDLGALTRVTVEVGGTLVDSDVVGQSVIWWYESVPYRGANINVLRIKLGQQGIPAGTYEDVRVTIYTAAYSDGLMIENEITITVID